MQKKYKASRVQKRMFILNTTDPENLGYNINAYNYFEGKLDIDRLISSIGKVIEKNPLFNAHFFEEGDELFYTLDSEQKADVIVTNVNIPDDTPWKEYLEQLEFAKPFDMKRDKLYRFQIIILGNDRFLLLSDFHHSVIDGISCSQFLYKEISDYYNDPTFEPVKYGYDEFVSWQEDIIVSKRYEKQKKYWKDIFSEPSNKNTIIKDYQKRDEYTNKTQLSNIICLPKNKVNEFCDKIKCTSYSYFIACLSFALSKLSYSNDITIGTVTSGRHHKSTKKSIGMFINTIPFRNQVRSTLTIKEYVKEVYSNVNKALVNSHVQYEDIMEIAESNDLFDVFFRYMPAPIASLMFDDTKCESVEILPLGPIANITVYVDEGEEEFLIRINYAKEFYKKETINSLLELFLKTIDVFADSEDMIVNNIGIVNEAEKNLILKDFNKTDVAYPKDRTVVELFEEQVEITPDNIAVAFEDKQLTYRGLNSKANSLAGLLRNDYGVREDDFIAIMAEKSLEMIVAILAIIKAGGAYVPIDPSYPAERISYMLEDASPKAVLVYKAEVTSDIPIVDLAESMVWEGVSENLLHINKPDDLLYCIYTSGTTGKPKGTMTINRNVIRLVKNPNYICLDENTSVLQTGALSFDASTLEIWGPLLNGGKLCLCDQEVLTDPKQLQKEMADKDINTLWLTSTLYNQTIEADDAIFKNLDYLLVGGEKLSEKHVRMLNRRGSNLHFINGYGPTESTTFAATYEVPEDFERMFIGKPISNTKIYILNGEELCGIRMPGELCIAGDGLARGYLNDAELTSEKFVENPYGEGKLYRSGDFARWMPDGNIEYLGRIDEQVKIRGFRIELGEIATRFQEIPYIKDAVVIARENQGDKYLCAYVVAEIEVSPTEVKEILRKNLPDYMIPAYIMQIEKIPVTKNGKLDKRSLPQPEYRQEEYVAPRNAAEATVVKAFEAILGIERVSVRDSFFDLGGDSIKAIRMVNKIRADGYDTSVKVILSEKTPEEIAKGTKAEIVIIKAEQGEIYGEVELTPIQRDFFKAKLSNRNYFNQSIMYEVTQRLDISALNKALSKITEHHDILRATYKDNKQIINRISDRKWYALNEYECKEEEIDKSSAGLQSSMDIENGPLMKAGLFHMPEKDYLLLIIHHLSVDGVSWRIITDDLEKGYFQAKDGEITLPEKTASYKAWSEAIVKYRDSYKLEREIEYWKKVNAKIAKGKIIKDSTSVSRKETIEISLESKYTQALLKKSNRAYNTEINDLFLTALVRGVYNVTGQSTLSVQLEGHGREEIGERIDIERTVGWFTSVYPVVLECASNGIEHDIRGTKEILRRIPNKGMGYGILKEIGESVFEIKEEPDITFNYLGEFSEQNNQVFKQQSFILDMDEKDKYGTSISINGGVFNGSLLFELIYDTGEYNNETVNGICEEFLSELKAVTDHCQKVESIQYTASDYGETEWTDEEFKLTKSKLAARGEEIQKIYPLTAMQEGMLYEKLANIDSTQYVIQFAMKFKKLNVGNMREAFQALVNKHDILHTVIKYKDISMARQILLKERIAEFTYLEVNSEEEYKEIKSNDVKRGFDLEDDSLIRMAIVKISEEDYRMILSNHHIVSDGWCTSIMFGDLFRFYELLETSQETPKENGGDFYKFVKYREEKDIDKSLSYWISLLEGYEEQSDILPMGTPDITDEECIRIETLLSKEMTQKAENLSASLGVTVSTLVEAVWGILLQKYNRTNDVVFGKVVSGRNAEVDKIEQMMGLFINTIPVRVKTDRDDTLETILLKLQKQAINSGEHDYCPLAEIQNNSDLGSGLVKTIIAFENYYVDDSFTQNINADFESMREQTSYGITLSVVVGERLNLGIEYDTSIYGKEEIKLLLDHLKAILEQGISNPKTEVKKLQMINPSERDKVLEQFNDTNAEYPNEKTVIELFEEQVKNTPDNIAVIFEDEKLTYRELNAKVNSLANKLRKEYGVQPNSFVAIMTERSLEMIVGIFAIIKAGGAYVPIDPTYPVERIYYMIDDSKPKAILAGTGSILLDTNVPIVDMLDSNNYTKSGDNLEHINKPTDILYVIYTSGTTGQPKGVMISHTSLINRIMWMNSSYPLNETDVIIQKTTYTFDVSVWELLWWSFTGSSVVMLRNGKEKEPEAISNEINRNKVTTMHFVPSMLKVFLGYIKLNKDEITKLKSLKYIFVSGEELKKEKVRDFIELLKDNNTSLINLYGPTEASIDVTYYNCNSNSSVVPIGRPISNTQIHILNGDELCGIGVPGELCIAGIGVAKGYLNKPELTAEKFALNPYGGGKLYRSGDLARWLPDGNIEYLGRIDEQVKIRGFRIELGEIESKIREISHIKDTAVIAREDRGDKYLCAYVVAKIKAKEIKEELRKSLPDYMIPAFIIQIEEIPVTRNGKLDKKSLPMPENQYSEEYVAPHNSMEMAVVKAFETILGVEQVGIRDNFFDLGGHSLKVMRLSNEIEKMTGARVSIKDLFAASTPELIAQIVKTSKNEYKEIVPIEKSESYAMSSAQKRLFMIDQISGANINYNMPSVHKLKDKIDVERLQETFNMLAAREEVLRTSFHIENGEPIQKIADTVEIKIEYSKQNYNVKIQQLFDDFVRPFDLGKAPLIRVKIVKTPNEYLLFLDMHHIISDGGSLPVMVQEIMELYAGNQLPEKRVQYKDFSAWQNKLSLDKQEEYWLNEFSGEMPVLDLQTDYTRPQEQSFKGSNLSGYIDEATREKVKELAREHGATEFMVLLTAFMATLSKYSRQEEIVIGTPISGRTHADTHNMLGMFVNTLAIKGELHPNQQFENLLQEIKNKCLKAYDNQEYQFEDLVEAVQVQRDMSRNPIFDVMFVLQNNEEAELKIGDTKAEMLDVQRNISKFDITLTLTQAEEGYLIDFEYCTDLFKRESIEQMSRHYINLLENALETPNKSLIDISMLDKAEALKVIREFNDTDTEYPREKTVAELFEEQVKKTPDNIALMFEDEQLTYRELNSKANILARRLRENYGVQADDFVAIMAERSLEMIVGILAVIKSGGAYVPLDPTYPEDRIRYMLEDASPKAVLVYKAEVISNIPVIDLADSKIWEGASDNLQHINKPEDLLYCIYTSGTSGYPKGVMVENSGYSNLMICYKKSFKIDSGDRFGMFFNYIFDGSIWEITMSLLTGAGLVVLSKEEIQDFDKLKCAVESKRINTMAMAPQYALQTKISGLKTLMTGGSEASIALLDNVNHMYINAYGPTEATIFATYWEYQKGDLIPTKIPIGKPACNMKTYILNGDELCGIGVPGELCIAGAGVARGYLNKPELTDEKFVQNPYGEGRMYRSGDLARWLPDGNIEYLGRIDEQVKIRGFRIELSEIESKIREIPYIKDTAVIAREDKGDKYLCAYVVADMEVSAKEIKEELHKSLPDYMIPDFIMQIDEIPVTRSGKLNKKSLPMPEYNSGNEYVAPRNSVEAAVVKAFEAVLGVERVSVTDNFFDLGGHSLKATKLSNEIEKTTGVKIALKDIFSMSTPELIGERIGVNMSNSNYTDTTKANSLENIEDEELF